MVIDEFLPQLGEEGEKLQNTFDILIHV